MHHYTWMQIPNAFHRAQIIILKIILYSPVILAELAVKNVKV
jgi:hypothetical protein